MMNFAFNDLFLGVFDIKWILVDIYNLARFGEFY